MEKAEIKCLNENNYSLKDYNSNKANRNYGIDLYKALATLNIIILHYNLHSKLLNLNHSSHNFKKIWCLEILSYWGVNGFGLISGFVGYKKHKFSNLLYIWTEVFFYSIIISFILYITNDISFKEVILSFFPILIKRHWYVNSYISLYLFLPFINEGLKNINKKTFRNIIIFFILFLSIYQTISKIFQKEGFVHLNNGYSISWLAILYIIGAYFGKYENKKKEVGFSFFLIFILLYFICSFITICFFFGLIELSFLPNNFLINYTSPTILFQAISLLKIFSEIKINNNYIKKVISFFNPLNFSVILIHGRLFPINNKMTKFLFNTVNNYRGKFTILIIYLISICLYFICTLFDYLRLLLFNLLKIRYYCELIVSKFQ